MIDQTLHPEDFPDSVYADEWRGDGRHTRFGDRVEAEYVVVHLRRVRLRARIWLSLAVALSLCFTVFRARSASSLSNDLLIHACVIVPSTLTLAALVWSRHYERFYLPVAGVLIPIYGATLFMVLCFALSIGREEVLSIMTGDMMAVFFFAGLRFRQALIAAATMLCAFVLTAFNVHLSALIFWKSLAILTLAGGIAAIVYRDIEMSFRASFLERALIGELVTRDGLSGLSNRRSFDEHLRLVWQHALRDQRPIGILMIDIDHFKSCNDAYGHQAGDLVIRDVAQCLRNFARRPLDLAARYGGEEFALILYDLSPVNALAIAERVREGVQQLHICMRALNPGEELKVTVSVGLCVVYPRLGHSLERALQLADEALYEAKAAGRNRVMVRVAEDEFVESHPTAPTHALPKRLRVNRR